MVKQINKHTSKTNLYVDYICSVTIVHLALLGFWNLYNVQLTAIPQLAKEFHRIERNPESFSSLNTCPCIVPDQSSPRPYLISLRSVLILSTHLLLGLPGVSLIQVSTSKPVFTYPLSP